MYVALIIFLMSLLFNYLFEPFVVYRPEHKLNYFWISFIHSLNAFIIVIIITVIASKIVNEDHWKVWKEIVLIGFILLMIGICQFLVRDLIYDNPFNWSFNYLIEEIRNTFLAGILFVFILVPLNYMRLNRRHFNTAETFSSKTQETDFSNQNYIAKINTHQKNDDFNMNVNSFLFARAEGNYLEIFIREKNEIAKLLKRMTLKELETQLLHFPNIFKTHRSYIVNLDQVLQVKGNAQGYQLLLDDYSEPIPVSRGMIADFEKQYKNI